jgi:arginyl-tRNA synthetase
MSKLETIIEIIRKELLVAIKKQNELINDFGVNVSKLNIQVELTKNPKFGDFASNIMMTLGLNRADAMKFAKKVAVLLPKSIFSDVQIANPGFINMFLNPEFNSDTIRGILKEEENYGKFHSKKTFYNIEFVSANPTGLLHIGHARNAAIGDTLCRI